VESNARRSAAGRRAGAYGPVVCSGTAQFRRSDSGAVVANRGATELRRAGSAWPRCGARAGARRPFAVRGRAAGPGRRGARRRAAARAGRIARRFWRRAPAAL